MAFRYSVRVSRRNVSVRPGFGFAAASAIERMFQVGHERVVGRLIGTRTPDRRHRPAPELSHHLLPGLGMSTEVCDIEPGERKSGSLHLFVVTAQAISVQDGLLRRIRRRLSPRRLAGRRLRGGARKPWSFRSKGQCTAGDAPTPSRRTTHAAWSLEPPEPTSTDTYDSYRVVPCIAQCFSSQRLERQPRPDLHRTAATGAGNPPEIARVDGRRGVAPVFLVQHPKHVCTDLQTTTRPNGEILRDRGVHVPARRAASITSDIGAWA